MESSGREADTFCSDCSAILLEDGLGHAVEEAWAGRDAYECREPLVGSPSTHSRAEGRWCVIDHIWDGDILGIPIDHYRDDIFPEFPALRSSADAGCEFCSYAIKFIKQYTSEPLLRPGEGQLMAKENSQPIRLYYKGYSIYEECLVITYELPNVGIEGRFFFPLSAPLHSSVGQHLKLGQLTVPEAQDAAYVGGLIRYWIDSCDEDHHCLPPSADLPTRLLFLGDAHVPEPRLVDTASLEDLRPGPEYIALSYVWGDPRVNKLPPATSTSNLEERRRQIDFATLPACFQDIMEVALALGVRYVWIDSLCILQDDEQDWDREASLMAQVYQNATVTFVAATGESVDCQLFQRQTGERLVMPSLIFKSSRYNDVQGRLSLYPYSGLRGSGHLIGKVKRASRWATRGWTFQEGEVSRRVVYFSGGGFAFKCQRETIEEDQRFGRRWRRGDADERTILSKVFDLLRQGDRELHPEGDMRHELWWHWQKVCMKYSPTLLTYPKDKLPALSAVAKIFHEYLPGETYVAGIWSGRLVQELLWSPSLDSYSRRGSGHRLTLDAGPTWSWVSWAGGVCRILLGGAEKWNMVDVPGLDIQPKIRLRGRNPYGQVSPRSHLKVHAQNVFNVCSMKSTSYSRIGWYSSPTTLIIFRGGGGKQLGYGNFDEPTAGAVWKTSRREMIALPLTGLVCPQDCRGSVRVDTHGAPGDDRQSSYADLSSLDENMPGDSGRLLCANSRSEEENSTPGGDGELPYADSNSEGAPAYVDDDSDEDEEPLPLSREKRRAENFAAPEPPYNAPQEASFSTSDDDENSWLGDDRPISCADSRSEGESSALGEGRRWSRGEWGTSGEDWSPGDNDRRVRHYADDRSSEGEDSQSSGGDGRRLSYVGLLLMSRLELGPNVFERVGTFFFHEEFLRHCRPEARSLIII